MTARRAVIIATGGTIAMKYDEEKQGLVPACTGEDLARAVPGLGEVADLEFIQITNIASCGMTPEIMWRLHEEVDRVLARSDVSGVVITHGTDTVEETAYFLDLVHSSEKPVVLTAAMRGAGDTSPDGPMNILCAVRAAVSDEARGMGVMVCLNEILHAAADVMKTHAANPATFESPWWGPVGYVDCDRVVIRRKPLGVKRIRPKALGARVDVVKAVTGSGREYIDFAVSRGCAGIVVEGFGRGNIPPGMVPGIADAVGRGVRVVIVSRTLAGRVLDVYGYPGSVTDTLRAGVVMGGELSAAKARIKLLLALSDNPSIGREDLQALFD